MPNAVAAALVAELRDRADPAVVEGQRRVGIRPKTEQLGIKIPALRTLAKSARRDHDVALALWQTEIHEARILAALVDDPSKVSPDQMDDWATGWDSWDIVDGCCTVLFDRTPHASGRINAWARRRPEFIKRGAFSMIAGLAVHDKAALDEVFRGFFPLIEDAADDDRICVKKAVNWALRQIGKRNRELNRYALASAERIAGRGTPSARWISTDALRELRSDAVQRRLHAMNI